MVTKTLADHDSLHRTERKEHWNMVFIDSNSTYYDKVSQAPIEHDRNPQSPYIGKIPEECHALLVKLCKDTRSELLTYYFAIMDERSTQDDTVLLVCAETNEDLPLPTLRATFRASGTALMLYHSGHSSVAEDTKRAARERDGVYRGLG
jgi:hypothetical protein